MTITAVILLGLFACSSPPPDEEDDQSLVLQLVIADRPAGNHPVYTVPSGTASDHPQVRAWNAVKKLRARGMEAWPALLERLDDNRLSIALAAEIPCTVGRACFHLIANAINAPPPRGHLYDYNLLLNREGIRAWWKDRKGREIRDLRIEASLFAWTLAKYDGEKKYVEHYAGHLRKLGVQDPDAKAECIRRLTESLALPEKAEELVPILAAPPAGEFLQTRLAWYRARE